MNLRNALPILLLALLASLTAAPPARAADDPGKIPITTASASARDFYVQGRDAVERLRFNESRELFEKAVAADPNFPLGRWQLANAAITA